MATMISSRVNWWGSPGELGAMTTCQTELSVEPRWGEASPVKVTLGTLNCGARGAGKRNMGHAESPDLG